MTKKYHRPLEPLIGGLTKSRRSSLLLAARSYSGLAVWSRLQRSRYVGGDLPIVLGGAGSMSARMRCDGV